MSISKRKFDLSYLNQWTEENKVELCENYEDKKITREILIQGKCKTENCKEYFNKTFRSLIEMGGPYCNNCCKERSKENLLKRKNIGNTYKKWLELKTKIKYKDEIRYFNNKSEDIKENELISSSYIQSRCEYGGCCEIWKKKMPDLFECENFCCSAHAKIKGIEKKIKLQRENLEFKDSFSSEEKSKFWSKDNIDKDGKYIDPRYIHKKSGFKFLFECNDCKHKFKKSCAKVSNGEWCGVCIYQTEKKLLEFLEIIYSLKSQYKQNWCKNEDTERYLPFDFCIEKLKIIVELDGRQHFTQVLNWNNPEETQKRDIYKMKCANNNGFSVIRIMQEDVWGNKYDWKKELLDNINKIKDENIVQNIFMCKNDEYNNLKISFHYINNCL